MLRDAEIRARYDLRDAVAVVVETDHPDGLFNSATLGRVRELSDRLVALEGLGVVGMPPFMVASDFDSGRLVRPLADWRIGHEIPIWGVLPHRSYVPARVQVVLAAVSEVISEREPQWRAISG